MAVRLWPLWTIVVDTTRDSSPSLVPDVTLWIGFEFKKQCLKDAQSQGSIAWNFDQFDATIVCSTGFGSVGRDRRYHSGASRAQASRSDAVFAL